MAARQPVVRHFIACEEIERSADGQHYSLLKLVHMIRPLSGEPYPRIQPELQLFAMITDGHGRLPFTVELATWDGLEQRSIYTNCYSGYGHGSADGSRLAYPAKKPGVREARVVRIPADLRWRDHCPRANRPEGGVMSDSAKPENKRNYVIPFHLLDTTEFDMAADLGLNVAGLPVGFSRCEVLLEPTEFDFAEPQLPTSSPNGTSSANGAASSAPSPRPAEGGA